MVAKTSLQLVEVDSKKLCDIQVTVATQKEIRCFIFIRKVNIFGNE